MSLESWKAEFYPVEADKVPKKKALEHSLTKWIGLRKANLKKHDLQWHSSMIFDGLGGMFDVDDISCALCVNYPVVDTVCERCPIRPCEDSYRAFTGSGDPEPMIRKLRAAIKRGKR